MLLLRNQAADRGDKQFLKIRRQALEPLIDKLSELITAAQAEGRVAQDLHPYLAASALYLSLTTATLLSVRLAERRYPALDR